MFGFGCKDSDEYHKLKEALVEAESKKSSIEDNIYNLKQIQKDMDKELRLINIEIDRLHSIKNSMVTTRRSRSVEGKDPRRLFIDNLPFDATEEDLEAYFERYGDIESVKIPQCRFTNNSRGFGFVAFIHKNMANEALDDGPHNILGRTIRVELARAKLEPKKNHSKRYQPY